MYSSIRSDVRRNAVRKVVRDVLRYSKKDLSKETLAEIIRIISQYQVEYGVSVFMTPKKPDGFDVRAIGKIDTGKEYLCLWWTDNEGRNNTYKAYALGMTFQYKSGNNVAIYTEDDWIKEYPAFYDFLPELKGRTWKVKVFSRFNMFYKNVINEPGEWLLQNPTGRDKWDSTRPMAKLMSNNLLYIYQPDIKMKKDFFERLIKIV